MRLIKRRRTWVALGAVVLVAGGGSAAYALTRGGSSGSGSSTTTWVAATSGTQTQSVTATGTIEPAQQQDLSFTVPGTITAVNASVGEKVKKGAVLATVGTTALASAVTSAEAAVTAAEEQVSAEASASSTQQAAAAAQLASAQTQLTNAQDNLAAATIRAPFAGTIAAVSMAEGDVVGSGSSGPSNGSNQSSNNSSSSSSSDTITLISTEHWIVDASVGSADLAELVKGQQVQITPTGATQRVFGTVSSVGVVASSASGSSATFPVVVKVTGTPTGLYAGGSADLTIIVKQEDNVLTVPTLALHTVNGQTVVYLKKGSSKVTTPVTVGTSYGPSTQIIKGLVAGDEVEVTTTFPGGGTVRRNTNGTGRNGGGGFFGGNGGGASFPGGTFPNGGTFFNGGGAAGAP
ncbi:MAG TPA: HlyD family efflux transporter periplasmic adaptor subunit [Mycobacteriales bacterium]|nr:HlyD family efflux transporter periplasmic adaptor subunit [Mycobacteriales bacterium]